MTDPRRPGTAAPPVSARSQPRFRTRRRRDELAQAFLDQGADYDRLRPGYPAPALDLILQALPDRPGHPLDVVDLGAGTGKLSLALMQRGADVVAVDPSRAMLDVAQRAADGPPPAAGRIPPAADRPTPSAGSLRTVVGTAEATGLPDRCADLVTAAQAWHWFDTGEASAEAARLLRPGGMLALLWNTLDVQIPWVHRLTRIMHAGDVHKDDFEPPLANGFVLVGRSTIRWEDPLPTQDVIDLSRTRSYVATASEATRAKVLANLDWYLHEHLGHAPGAVLGLPYRTDVFLAAQRPTRCATQERCSPA